MSEHPSYEQYIIRDSGNISILIKLRDFVLTVALWAVYLYFIQAAFPFVVDLVHWIGNGFDDADNYDHLKILPTIEGYAKVSFIMIGVYFGWAIYNMLRFRGKDRRKPRAAVTVDDLASLYGLSPETVESWQEAKILIMHHDRVGHLTDVKIGH